MGGFNPAPKHFGDAKATELEALQNAIAGTHGSAIATERGTVAWVENHATARVVLGLFNAARRLGNVNDPERMTSTLPRWEKILGISSYEGQSLKERRDRVAAKRSLIAAGTSTDVLRDYLARVLGPMFVGLEFSDPLTATTYVPGGGAVPDGPTFLDGNDADPAISPYASSVAYVAIKLHRPDEMSIDEFYARAGQVYEDVDNLVGAWMDFDWVNDGDDGPGFFLDQDFNLDNQRFDV